MSPPQENELQKVKRLLATSQIFGSPGASLTWGIEGAIRGDVKAGIEGEIATSKILNAYTRTNPHITVFHSIRWPGNTQGDTDHIVLSGRQVIIIDSKRWKTKRKYSVTPNGTILRGTVRFPEGKVKMLPAINSWKKSLPRGAKIVGLICIAQKEVFVPYDDNWKKAPFKVVAIDNLMTLLDRTITSPHPTDLEYTPTLALPIMRKLIRPKPLPPRIDFSR